MTVSHISTNQPTTWSAYAEPAKAVTDALSSYLTPVLDLGLRIWMAHVFFTSGLQKIGDWGSTVFLFDFEYQVPLLPPEVAAFLATSFELVMPVLLVIGLMTRFAAVPLLGMALVIQFVLGVTNPAYDHLAHYYWMILLVTIVLRGPGRISIDHYLAQRFARRAG